jgi:arylformamidase
VWSVNVIDLSGLITSGMWSYGPPLPAVEILPVAELECEGWNGHALQLHTLAGTNIEAADHLLPGREPVADLPLERFITPAVVAQIPDKAPLQPVPARARGGRPGGSSGGGAPRGDRLGHDVGPPRLRRAVPVLPPGVKLNRRFFAAERLLLAPLVNLRRAESGRHLLVALPLNIPGD